MPIQLQIGSTTYQAPTTGERSWGTETTNLLVRLAQIANQVAQANYIITSNYKLTDTSGNFGVQANFIQGIGSTASGEGFIRMASPYGEPGQGSVYPVGTPEGKSFTYLSWRNSNDTGNIHLFPNSDNVTLQFAGKSLVNLDTVQALQYKVLDNTNTISGLAIEPGTIDGTAIANGANIAWSKLQFEVPDRVVITNGAGALSYSDDITVTELGHLNGVTSPIQTQINTVNTDLGTHVANTSNPHSVTKAQVGLGNVDNTSDEEKNVATATLWNKTLRNASVFNNLNYSNVTVQTAPADGVSVYANNGKLYSISSGNVRKELGGGGLTPTDIKTANYTCAVGEMVMCDSSAGPFTVTLPPVPAVGGVIGVLDATEACSATNYVRIAPASGQSLDGYPVDDTLDMDYVRANVKLNAAPGATSWKLEYQTTSMVQAGQLPGIQDGSTISAPFIGQTIEALGGTNGGTLAIASSGTNFNVTSLTLSQGKWEVSAHFYCAAGATTAWTFYNVGISLASASFDLVNQGGVIQSFGLQTLCPVNQAYLQSCGSRVFNVSSNTTVYLVAGFQYTTLGGAGLANGTRLTAKRIG